MHGSLPLPLGRDHRWPPIARPRYLRAKRTLTLAGRASATQGNKASADRLILSAADDLDNTAAGDRPRLPAAQAPGPRAALQPAVRRRAGLLSGSNRGALHGGAPARHRAGGP